MKKETISHNFWQVLLRSAAASIFSWRVVAKDLFTIGILWGTYLTISSASMGGVPIEVVVPTPLIFWLAMLGSGISFVLASIKSILPAILILIAIIPLAFLGFDYAARVALVIANVAVILHSIGFVLFGVSPTWFKRK